jgi:hypothetical protein
MKFKRDLNKNIHSQIEINKFWTSPTFIIFSWAFVKSKIKSNLRYLTDCGTSQYVKMLRKLGKSNKPDISIDNYDE